ncbi:MAG TPA: tagaturonate epimerase family protein [Burkholderiales bacterium]|nr:tagaturonate epimerase family protein [Burkholderiales bacterium]
MALEKFSLGVGDRFGREGQAQLRALETARRMGAQITPVWNKSHREHTLTGTTAQDARRSADRAVRAGGWPDAYYVDADHITMLTVDDYIVPCDYFTIDVADLIGRPPAVESAAAFLKATSGLKGELRVTGLRSRLEITDTLLADVALKYLSAIEEAGRIYRRVADRKAGAEFVVEVSFDEADAAQTPEELLLILAAIGRQGIPIRTIAPRFSGSFLKGVDYAGDPEDFDREFEADVAVLNYARPAFGLPSDLKLSVHSGSDKFSLYPIMHRVITARDAGLHLKTAGTTWLEEVAGLAASGGEGLRLAKEIYTAACDRFDELVRPYLAVTAIDRDALPSTKRVSVWDSQEFVGALEHEPSGERFNRNFRQLLHISYPIAAEMGERFTDLLESLRGEVEARVTANLLRRHIGPLFLGGPVRVGEAG